jgi:predicted nucleotidyltransferase
MNLEEALRVLSEAGVEFVIVGGVAAVLHGSAYITFDLDICYSRAAANLKRLRQALEPFHPRPRGFPKDLPFVWDEATLRNHSVLTLQTDLGEIDLLAEIAGLGAYDEVRARSRTVEALGSGVAVLDLQGLIEAKRAAGREKDLTMLPELESLIEAEDAE